MDSLLQLNHASSPPLHPAWRDSEEPSSFAKPSADRCAGVPHDGNGESYLNDGKNQLAMSHGYVT